MSYIGRGIDKISNIEKLDTITFDGSSSYTLQKNSVNFTPNSANSLQISIDGVVQAGNFTVSGSTIDFGVAIPATSTNDFIFHYGTGLITTPADGTVGLDKLSATGTKDATTFLRGDNTFAEPSGGGITEAEQWRITATVTITGDFQDITANWEKADTDGAGSIGAGMTESSGIFTFPSTGIWKIEANAFTQENSFVNYTGLIIRTTTNNSSYGTAASTFHTLDNDGTENNYTNLHVSFIFDVTDTTNCKIKLQGSTSASTLYFGSSADNYTYLTFIRLGDT